MICNSDDSFLLHCVVPSCRTVPRLAQASDAFSMCLYVSATPPRSCDAEAFYKMMCMGYTGNCFGKDVSIPIYNWSTITDITNNNQESSCIFKNPQQQA